MKHAYWKLRHILRRLVFRLTRPQVHLPRYAVIGPRATFSKGRMIEIGERFFCGHSCHFGAPVKIGQSVMFAPCVGLVGGDHKIDTGDLIIMDTGPDWFHQIVIEDGAWLGYGSIVLHGVSIGKGAVVAAGSVVTKDVPPLAVVAGNPARFVRYREGFR